MYFKFIKKRIRYSQQRHVQMQPCRGNTRFYHFFCTMLIFQRICLCDLTTDVTFNTIWITFSMPLICLILSLSSKFDAAFQSSNSKLGSLINIWQYVMTNHIGHLINRIIVVNVKIRGYFKFIRNLYDRPIILLHCMMIFYGSIIPIVEEVKETIGRQMIFGKR